MRRQPTGRSVLTMSEAPDNATVPDGTETDPQETTGERVQNLVPDEDVEVEPAPTRAPDATDDATKPTDQWVTGDEPMTGPQHSYLQTLAREAGRDLPGSLTKAQASELIEELQQATGRGRS